LLDVPLALPTLGLPPMHGLMVFTLAVGLFFAVPLFTLIFSRLVFEPPLPDALKPSLLLGQLRNLPLCCPFRVSWWAVSFPLAASSIASLRFVAARPGIVTDAIALALLALATLIIAALFGRTLLGVGRGELRTLST
jgi:tellurite resistance protein